MVEKKEKERKKGRERKMDHGIEGYAAGGPGLFAGSERQEQQRQQHPEKNKDGDDENDDGTTRTTTTTTAMPRRRNHSPMRRP